MNVNAAGISIVSMLLVWKGYCLKGDLAQYFQTAT